MSEAHRRSKQPEVIHAEIIKAAISIIANDGFETLTLSKVAMQAGVSKGGLQYHFSCKEDLLEGAATYLFELLGTLFEETFEAEPEGASRLTRAYIKVNFVKLESNHAKAFSILTLKLPKFAAKQREWLDSVMARESAVSHQFGQLMLVCRLAADGFWAAETAGVLSFDDSTKIALLGRLLALAETSVAGNTGLE